MKQFLLTKKKIEIIRINHRQLTLDYKHMHFLCMYST